MRRILATMLIFLCLCSIGAYAHVAMINRTENNVIHIVPTPEDITIDGDLADWDMSGAIIMCMDESSKSLYSCRAVMMYDKEYLYVACHVKDPTPMINNYSLGGNVGLSWNADAIQVRFYSDPEKRSMATTMTGGARNIPKEEQHKISHVTLWYSTIDKKAGFLVCHTLSFQDTRVNPEGVVGAYKKDADGKGYVLEYKIPYGVIHAPRPYKAGDEIQAQFQIHWGKSSGMGLRCGMTDLRNPAGYEDLGFHGPRGWGSGVFEEKGNLKLKQKTALSRADGHIPVPFELEKDRNVSLAVYDKDGNLVRTCLGAQPYKAGKHTYQWDGLSDKDKPMPVGKYTYKTLTHTGITPKYVCNVGVTGNPSYQTEDDTGGWAGDYRQPFVMSTTGDYIVLGTSNAEAAHMIIITDLNGKKLYPVGSIGGIRAVGAFGDYGYAVSQNGKLGKFSLKTGQETPFSDGATAVTIREQEEGEDKKSFSGAMWNLKALAFLEETIYISSFNTGRLYAMDLKSGKLKQQWDIERPWGLAVTPNKTLFMIHENELGIFDTAKGEFRPLVKDLDEPRMLACDAEGNLYVSLQGKTMQVWKFSPKGKVLFKYGKAGGRPMIGPFDPQGLLKPYAIAVDSNGRLWIAEEDDMPKRYSVWNKDGTLHQEHFGSIPYSTQSAIDLAEPQFIYMEGVQYEVDYEKGTWKPKATVLRTREIGEHSFPGCAWTSGGNHSCGTYANIQGRKFFFNRGLKPTLYEVVKDEYIPRMLLIKAPKRKGWGGPIGTPGKLWIDSNNDGKVQEEEIRDTNYLGCFFGFPMDRKLNWYSVAGVPWAPQGGSKLNVMPPFKITRLTFKGFNKQGGLEYSAPANLEVLVEKPAGGRVGGLYVDETGDCYILLGSGTLERGERPLGAGHRIVKYGPDGKQLWQYQNVECAFAWNSGPYTPGYLVSAIGFSEQHSKDLLAVTGYYGQYFLLDKETGLFVDALGEDQRSAYTMGSHMVLTENFNGMLFDHPKNGKSYFVGGDCDQRVWEINGLGTIQKNDGAFTVTEEQFAKVQKNAEHNFKVAAAKIGRKITRIKPMKKANIDGKDKEWGNVEPLPIHIDEQRAATAKIGYDTKNLYLQFSVTDESPLLNSARDYKHLFKTGDAVELQFGRSLSERKKKQTVEQPHEGDMRILITRDSEGKMIATLLRYHFRKGKKPNQHTYESHWKEVVDEVRAVNDLPMASTVGKDEYMIEVAVPWTLLGVEPKPEMTLTGDVGVIYGNKGGTRNSIRYMWSDKSPEISINNDIPSEVRVHPNSWGRLILK